MRLRRLSDPEAAAEFTAGELVGLISSAQSERGTAHVSLAGGGTPGRTYELLADRGVDWRRVELWFGDERCVGPDHPDSNYRMVAETLLSRIELPTEQVHRMRGELGPEPAAADYARVLGQRLGTGEGDLPRLDVCLLGLGEDGHTASLFPDAPELDVRGVPCVGVHNAPKPPPERVTLTLDMLTRARRSLVLATGAGKAAAVAAVLKGPDRHFPASLLHGAPAELIVDEAAAAQLAEASSETGASPEPR
jgi:6-phosphogluconolactonase